MDNYELAYTMFMHMIR